MLHVASDFYLVRVSEWWQITKAVQVSPSIVGLHTSSDCFYSSSGAQTGWFISLPWYLYKLLINKMINVFQFYVCVI